MVTTEPFAETRTVLPNISWQTFKAMLTEMGEVQNSATFAPVPVKDIPQFIQKSRKIGQLAAKRDFRDWIRQFLT